MPPRGRSSSSSRSSSSRSSSFRSSSSRSYSSRSSSRPSSRSTSYKSSRSSYPSSDSSRPSSRSTSYYNGNSTYRNDNYYNKNFNYETKISKDVEYIRKAKIFAQNYKRSTRLVSSFIENNKHRNPILHHCFKHDYYYFDEPFVDSITNTTYNKGYYDENGTFYENITLDFSKMETISLYTCDHCGGSQKIELITIESNESLICQNCGALIDLNNIFDLNIDYYVSDENGNLLNESLLCKNSFEDYKPSYSDSYSSSYSTSSYSYTSSMDMFSKIIVFIITFVIIMVFINAFSNLSIDNNNFDDNSYYEDNNSYGEYYDYKLLGDEIFVSAINRYCYFDGDYYYDEVTDCYFCYNTDVEVPTMQFWFEDFSSQYGDYGWVEYNSDNNTWYVEVGLNEWEEIINVPNYFWHTSFSQLLIDNNINQ